MKREGVELVVELAGEFVQPEFPVRVVTDAERVIGERLSRGLEVLSDALLVLESLDDSFVSVNCVALRQVASNLEMHRRVVLRGKEVSDG